MTGNMEKIRLVVYCGGSWAKTSNGGDFYKAEGTTRLKIYVPRNIKYQELLRVLYDAIGISSTEFVITMKIIPKLNLPPYYARNSVKIDDDERAKVLVRLNPNPALTTPLFVTMHPIRAAAAANSPHKKSDYMAEDAFSSSGTRAELDKLIRFNRGKKRRILTREEEVMRKWRGRLCKQCGHNLRTCTKNPVSLHSRPKIK